MRVLVACEFSGIVRDAFRKRGHAAMSCDWLPSERPGPHLVGDVLKQLGDSWDMMIAFPPCTHLAVSGARYFARKRKEQAEALGFVRALLGAPIPKIALENPVGVISTAIRKPDQIIQPYLFGHDASKATCLWLKGLPPLNPTRYVDPVWSCGCRATAEWRKGKCATCGKAIQPRWGNQTASGQNRLGPSPDRWKLRSRTYQGIADAMALQWG